MIYFSGTRGFGPRFVHGRGRLVVVSRMRLAVVGLILVAGLAVPALALGSAPGTIATVAGDPTASGPAIDLGQQPYSVARAPGGGLYLLDLYSAAVREVSASGQESTVAGNGTAGYAGDNGPATSAELNADGMGVDSGGDLLIADSSNYRVRLVAAASCSSGCPFGLSSMTKGDIYTVAGDGARGYSGDGGPATSAKLNVPYGVGVDSGGDLLIADENNDRVRLVAAASCSSGCPYGLSSMTEGDIYTIAGDGSFGYAGNGGPATSGKLGNPTGVGVDGSGDLLIADYGNNAVRLVAAVNCSSGCPYGLSSMVEGDIYTVAGDGTNGYSGDGGPATGAKLASDTGVSVDSGGDLLIADYGNYRVRLVAAASCSSGCPYGLSSMTKGDIYTVAGDGTYGYSGDGGPATSAELYEPPGVTIDSGGDLLIADGYRMRLVAAASCASACPFGLSSMSEGDIYTIAGNGSYGYAGDGGPASSAELNGPPAVAIDRGGDLLIADSGYTNDRVRLVAAASCSSGCPYGLTSTTMGDIYTVAGDGADGYSGNGGLATSAKLNGPQGVAVDVGGNLLIADTDNSRVRLVAAASCSSGCPYGLSSTIKGHIYAVAGDGSYGSSGDGGPAISAELADPDGVAVDPGGNLLIADTGNSRVRLVAAASCSSGCPYGLASMTEGDIYTIAGDGTYGFSGDGGPATSAELAGATRVSVDSGRDLLIADSGNSRVRLVAAASCSSGCPYGLASMSEGDIYTIAGDGTFGFSGDRGPATSAKLSNPDGVAVDSGGDLLIADTHNNRVRLVAAANCSRSCAYGLSSMTKGDIYTVAGDGTYGYSGDGGRATSAKLAYPLGVAIDSGGDLLVADTNNNRVRLVAPAAPTVSAVSPTAGPTTGGQSVTVTGTNFAPGATVQFGTTAASSVTFVSATKLTVLAPAHAAGSVNVTVTTAGGTSATSTANLFAYGPPTISSFSPSSGVTGSNVTITGGGFAAGMTVKFGSLRSPTVTVSSGTQLVATVPDGATTGAISVSDTAGGATSTTNYTVKLSITAFSPSSGAAGTVVTIKGRGFNSSSTAEFNGAAATGVTLVSSSELQVTVPTGATTGPITVTNTSATTGTVASRTSFTVS